MGIPARRNTLTMESYRQRLAGLMDESITASDPAAFEAQAIDLTLLMAELYNRDEMDPKALWSRIASGLEQSARENQGDAAALINACLLHIKADAGRSSRSEHLAELMDCIGRQNAIWHRQWARWIAGHLYIIVAKARAQWQARKENQEG